MDKRVYAIILLAVLAVVFSLIRESYSKKPEKILLQSILSKHSINSNRIAEMGYAIVVSRGITKKQIHNSKKNNNISIFYPENFDVLQFIKTMKDSLEQFNAHIVSIENPKERNTSVQITSNNKTLANFIFYKESTR